MGRSVLGMDVSLARRDRNEASNRAIYKMEITIRACQYAGLNDPMRSDAFSNRPKEIDFAGESSITSIELIDDVELTEDTDEDGEGDGVEEGEGSTFPLSSSLKLETIHTRARRGGTMAMAKVFSKLCPVK